MANYLRGQFNFELHESKTPPTFVEALDYIFTTTEAFNKEHPHCAFLLGRGVSEWAITSLMDKRNYSYLNWSKKNLELQAFFNFKSCGYYLLENLLEPIRFFIEGQGVLASAYSEGESHGWVEYYMRYNKETNDFQLVKELVDDDGIQRTLHEYGPRKISTDPYLSIVDSDDNKEILTFTVSKNRKTTK